MGEFLNFFKSKKNLINTLLLGIFILAIPLGINLARQQQIIKSRATGEPIVFVGDNLRLRSDGSVAATTPQVSFQINSSLGDPGGTQPGPSSTPLPTGIPTAAPVPTATPASTSAPTPTPVPPVNSTCSDGTVCKVGKGSSIPACCAPVPCSAYSWKLIEPGTNQAPGLDATRFGMGNDGQGNGCSQNSDCPKNTNDPFNVDPKTSNWCYEFTEGNRCIQLQHQDGAPACGTADSGSTCDNIDFQDPDIGASCAACLSTKVPTVPGIIKSMNGDYNSCSNQQLYNKWCNGGISPDAQTQCNDLKSGDCAEFCQ